MHGVVETLMAGRQCLRVGSRQRRALPGSCPTKQSVRPSVQGSADNSYPAFDLSLRSQPGLSDRRKRSSQSAPADHFQPATLIFHLIDRLISLLRLRTKFGERAFTHAGPATWNALPDHTRTVAAPVKFRKLLC